MSVAAVTQFPSSFVAGDAVRVTIGDSNHPSSLWTLVVWFQNGVTVQNFSAPAGTGGAYDLFITPTQSAAIPPGQYLVAYVFTEIASPNDRITRDCEFTIRVYANPAVTPTKSPARILLEAMEAAWLTLSSGAAQTVNFNGQSFTNRNENDFWKMLVAQRAIVAAEDAARLGHRKLTALYHPL